MEDQVEVIKSNKGGMKVIHKGYMYTVHKKRQCGGIRWRCAQRSLHCKGSISTGIEGTPKVNMPHNHLPDLHSVALARGRQGEDFAPISQFLDLKFEEDTDSMPLQERLSKVAAQEKISGQGLKSQPLSPTKLKVTRQQPKVKQVEAPPSPVNEEMCLRWNSHHSNMQTAFPSILSKEQYVDVTLAAEGKTLKCHRLILSSCSPYFEEILSGISPFQHPVLFMRDIPFWILKSLCDFMYAGEVHIYQNKLEELLAVAEALKIKGLAGKSTSPDNHEHKTSNNKEPKEKKKPYPQVYKKIPQTSQNNSESTSHDYEDDVLDPLELLEPLYEEAAEEKKVATIVKPKENKYHYQQVKKPFARRLRKRKLSEQREPSPPPVFTFRKGTRSRPNVKIPKYYHTDYTASKPPNHNAQDPLLDVDEIKTEPIDVEDNLIDYSDQEHAFDGAVTSLVNANATSDINVTNEVNVTSDAEEIDKIALSEPVITEVHSIDETKEMPTEEKQKDDNVGNSDEVQGQAEAESEKQTVEKCDSGTVKEPTNEETGKDEGQTEENETQIEGYSVNEENQNTETVENQPERESEETGNVNEDVPMPELRIADVRTTIEDDKMTAEGDVKKTEDAQTTVEDNVKATSLENLEKEAMNVVNVINMHNQQDSNPE